MEALLQANDIDSLASPFKVIVSVLMLKEGWDVRNVTTIVGLRAYAAKSNILPEQTLGRGLRKMYPGGIEEYVSVVGTDAFMDFVESMRYLLKYLILHLTGNHETSQSSNQKLSRNYRS